VEKRYQKKIEDEVVIYKAKNEKRRNKQGIEQHRKNAR
jgi:hypothetical protein